ncbi:hypothetical protein DBA29_25175 [Xenophilus aerolatus]|nr:hypothetical protein [Xenophilus aerolatus]
MGRRVLRLYEVAQISLGIPPSSKLPTAQINEELAERITDLCAWMAPAFSVDGNVLVVEHPNNDLEDSMRDQYVDAWVGLQLIKEKYGSLTASTEAFEASITSSPLGSDSGVANPAAGLDKGGDDQSPTMQQKMLATAAKLLVVLVDQQIGQVRSKSVQRLADALVEQVDSSRYAVSVQSTHLESLPGA